MSEDDLSGQHVDIDCWIEDAKQQYEADLGVGTEEVAVDAEGVVPTGAVAEGLDSDAAAPATELTGEVSPGATQVGEYADQVDQLRERILAEGPFAYRDRFHIDAGVTRREYQVRRALKGGVLAPRRRDVWLPFKELHTDEQVRARRFMYDKDAELLMQSAFGGMVTCQDSVADSYLRRTACVSEEGVNVAPRSVAHVASMFAVLVRTLL